MKTFESLSNAPIPSLSPLQVLRLAKVLFPSSAPYNLESRLDSIFINRKGEILVKSLAHYEETEIVGRILPDNKFEIGSITYTFF